MKLHQVRPLRWLALHLLRLCNPGDIVIRHHWVPGARIKLHSWRHKGYWYHGARREPVAMRTFRRLIEPGDDVFDIGAHIGYLSVYFADLTGGSGTVSAFEPGANNLPYLRENARNIDTITIFETAVSERDGAVAFYLEDLTGQNNSLIANYEGRSRSEERAWAKASVRAVEVASVRLDTFIARHRVPPDFVKIDVEGAELLVLEGMERCLAECPPKLMVEVTAEAEEVRRTLAGHGYRLLTPRLAPLMDSEALRGNVFCLHARRHRALLAQLGLGPELWADSDCDTLVSADGARSVMDRYRLAGARRA